MNRSTPSQSVVIHGHFYQPPREDPWLEVLERQPTAVPHHDWNVRVEQECYRAVAAARIPGPDGRISEVLNTLEHISFNFGPTLLQWMEALAPRTYQAILAADAVSGERCGGHGNALAQAYHHTILPLASRREKVSEVRWGMADFRRRFGREPQGMWLPETAVDGETLDVLAQEGIAFTILAPHQVATPPRGGLPGLFRASGGKTIALFLYDGALSHGVAFGGLLKDAEVWADRMASAPRRRQGGGQKSPLGPEGPRAVPRRLVSIATDGETYGHHHPFGEMALAKVLRLLHERPGIRVENFASFLSRNPPVEEVELVEPSSWSCIHGVERWRDECGCKMDPSKATQQGWRKVLRAAMDELAQGLHRVYLEEASNLLCDPWEARDAQGGTGPGRNALDEILRAKASRPLTPEESVRARELLEMERNALRLFTSCGWFFDDLAGLEPLQVLRYAARAVELAGKGGVEMEAHLLTRLATALTNEDPPRKGSDLYLEEVKPRVPPHLAVAAGAAAQAAIGIPGKPGVPGKPGKPGVPGYAVEHEEEGRFRIVHGTTGREWFLGATVERLTAGRLRVKAWPWGAEAEAIVLGLPDLPEAYRVPVEEALREALLDLWIPLEERIRARRAGKTLQDLIGSALVAAVASLEMGEKPETLDGIRDLADLHHLLGLPIPFDAQTDFHRVLKSAAPEEGDPLFALKDPLGFVTT